jgi:2-oxoglutarate dehydrogenase complex dehydrogenase (E1) component-like enzyme
VSAEQVQQMKDRINKKMNDAYVKSKTHEYDPEDWVTEEWESIKISTIDRAKNSGVDLGRLRDVGTKISELPPD